MMLEPLVRIGFIAALTAIAAAGQQPAAPGAQFEVVSIRPIPPNAPPILREQTFTPILPGGQFIDSRVSLGVMIGFAYDVEDPSIRLLGLDRLPSSVNRSYAVSAKPAPGFPALPPAENREKVRLMLRAMLEDRFHLQLHTEMREGRVYHLETAKGGFKFQEVAPPVPPETEGFVNAAMGDSGGRIIGKKSTMSGMAKMLVVFLKRPVIDRTGLKGYYDFDVKWNAPESPDGQRPADTYGAAASSLLISILQERFGLRLRDSAGPVKYWIVDHAEPPTEN